MTIQITISGNTVAELKEATATLSTLIGVASGGTVKAESPLTPSEQARLRGDATVVPAKAQSAAEKKAAKKAAEAEAAKAAEAEAAATNEKPEDEATDTSADDEALGETETSSEELTNDDVKKLLIEVRGVYPKDATIISRIVQEFGKKTKISDVDAKQLPKVAAECRRLLKAAKK